MKINKAMGISEELMEYVGTAILPKLVQIDCIFLGRLQNESCNQRSETGKNKVRIKSINIDLKSSFLFRE